MKRYIVTSNETMEYYKIVEAKNEWKADYNNTEVIDQEVEKYDE